MDCSSCTSRSVCTSVCPEMAAILQEPEPKEKPLPWYGPWCGDYKEGLADGMRAKEIREYLDGRSEFDRLVCVLHIAGYANRHIGRIVRKDHHAIGLIVARYEALFGEAPPE